MKTTQTPSRKIRLDPRWIWLCTGLLFFGVTTMLAMTIAKMAVGVVFAGCGLVVLALSIIRFRRGLRSLK